MAAGGAGAAVTNGLGEATTRRPVLGRGAKPGASAQRRRMRDRAGGFPLLACNMASQRPARHKGSANTAGGWAQSWGTGAWEVKSGLRSLWPVFTLAVPGARGQPGVSVLVHLPGLSGEVKMARSERGHAARVRRAPPA